MDKNRKKQLKEAYKFRKPDMGIIALKCTSTGELFLDTTRDIERGFNRYGVQLDTGTHPNRRLQELWNEMGEEGFERLVLSHLDYDDPEEDQTRALDALLEKELEAHPGAVCIWRSRRS